MPKKSDSAKALELDDTIKIVANQVCALITRHGRQARIDANEFNSDALTFLNHGVLLR